MTLIATLSFGAMMFATLGGCAAVFPTLEHRSGAAGTRGEIPATSLGFITLGSSSRADVMLALGEPDIVLNADRFFAYRWSMTTGGWFVVIPTAVPIGGGQSFTKDYALLIEFDEHGIVKRFETKVEGFAGKLGYEELTTW